MLDHLEASHGVAFSDTIPQSLPAPEAVPPLSAEADPVHRRHAEAGRKGGRRVHQLIQEGRLYEKEHGLKSGRQRLRQLVELGKLYEEEHSPQPELPKKHSERLARPERHELLATLVHCLLRIAKPSFRPELLRLAETLQQRERDHAA
jgi:hypothetical protein